MVYEFLLFDRIEKIRAINKQLDLEHNGYIAFSGGKDSTILHYLIDLALPDNKIPRVFSNTGLEYSDVVKFVKKMAKNDSRIIILNQTRNIKKTLEKYGYPFKSKEHSMRVYQFNKGSNADYILKKYLGNDSSFSCPKMLRFQFKERDLDIMREFLPNEYKQCWLIWGYVYNEYRRIGYRLHYNLFNCDDL